MTIWELWSKSCFFSVASNHIMESCFMQNWMFELKKGIEKNKWFEFCSTVWWVSGSFLFVRVRKTLKASAAPSTFFPHSHCPKDRTLHLAPSSLNLFLNYHSSLNLFLNFHCPQICFCSDGKNSLGRIPYSQTGCSRLFHIPFWCNSLSTLGTAQAFS